jgi:hypothetical protein
VPDKHLVLRIQTIRHWNGCLKFGWSSHLWMDIAGFWDDRTSLTRRHKSSTLEQQDLLFSQGAPPDGKGDTHDQTVDTTIGLLPQNVQSRAKIARSMCVPGVPACRAKRRRCIPCKHAFDHLKIKDGVALTKCLACISQVFQPLFIAATACTMLF